MRYTLPLSKAKATQILLKALLNGSTAWENWSNRCVKSTHQITGEPFKKTNYFI
jgi:hypothetical protein